MQTPCKLVSFPRSAIYKPYPLEQLRPVMRSQAFFGQRWTLIDLFNAFNKAFEANQGKHCESREREEGFQKPGVGADLKKGKKYFLLRF